MVDRIDGNKLIGAFLRHFESFRVDDNLQISDEQWTKTGQKLPKKSRKSEKFGLKMPKTRHRRPKQFKSRFRLKNLIFFLKNLKFSPKNQIFKIPDCRCPRFTESYSIEGSFSIDLYATLGPVDHIDYSNQCTNVRVTCTSFSPQWDSDGWAVYNGTMTSLLSGTSRIWCGDGGEWNVEMKKGETQIWTDVSVYCQSYRAR